MSSKYEELLQRIKNHFENITPEELEEGLKRAGYRRIESASESGWELMDVEEDNT